MEHGPADSRQKKPIGPSAKDLTLHDLSSPKRLLGWKLDWKEYFKRFCEAHGGNPIEINGRLVLPDGWSYSSTDYKGPEWEPPQKLADRVKLLTSYWSERRGIVADELKLLKETRRGLVEQLIGRSVPLVRKIKRRDEASGKLRWDREDVTLDAIDVRISWLQEDLAACLERLEELRREDHGIQNLGMGTKRADVEARDMEQVSRPR